MTKCLAASPVPEWNSLTAYFQSPGSVAPAPSTEPVPSGDGDRNMTVASVPGRDDFRPESQGIFRLFRTEPAVPQEAVLANRNGGG